MKKSNLLKGVAAMAMGLAAVGCSHEIGGGEADLRAQIIAEYNEMFIKTFGKPASNQDWGFGGGTRAMFTETWSGTHTCGVSNWEDVLTFEKPENAVDLTRSDLFPDGNNLGDQFKNVEDWYVPAGFNGSLNLHNMNLGGNVYVLGKLTDLQSVNYNGTVTFYVAKKATLKYTVSSGNRHNIINAGDLEVAKWSNVGELYNGGSLTVTDTDVPNTATIYSNGDATIYFPNGGDLKATCDIHGTITVGNIDEKEVKNLKIQNSTSKYICGIVSLGTVENVDGPLRTSYVKADVFKFDGNPIYLLPGGHVDVTTLQVPNSNSHFYGAANSTGLVEAVNYEFGNKNDFTHTFSSNIYFKVNGGYIKCANCYAMGHNHEFNNVDEYLAYDGHSESQSDEYQLAKDRINAGNATGAPECGQPWTVGTTPDEGEGDGDGDGDGNNNDTANWEFKGRVFAEDLTVKQTSDFDFNDVVFDVYHKEGSTKIVLLAAGGTLPLYVGGYEVHEVFGLDNTTTMVNTGSLNGASTVTSDPVAFYLTEKLEPAEIVITVMKDGTSLRLSAEVGKTASKFRTDEKLAWANERQDIDAVMNFSSWVQDASVPLTNTSTGRNIPYDVDNVAEFEN